MCIVLVIGFKLVAVVLINGSFGHFSLVEASGLIGLVMSFVLLFGL